MIVAIIAVATNKVEEFRIADTVAAAVAASVNAYTPPRNIADYIGHDTGWTKVQPAKIGWRWDGATLTDGTLSEAQQARIAEIDARTDELIAGGFPFDDGNGGGAQIYSLGLPAQSRMEGVYALREDDEFTWPLQWSCKNDSYVAEFEDATEFRAFFLTAAGYLRTYIQSAYPIRLAIMTATTVAEVNAVVDPR